MFKNILMKKFFIILFVSLFCVNYSIASITFNTGKKTSIPYLLIQNAKSGTLIYDKAAQSYQLELRGLDNSITYFTNSPAQMTGTIKTQDFAICFEKEIKINKPNGINVGLVAIQGNKKTIYTLTLKNSHYDVNANKITYDAQLIPGTQRSIIKKRISFISPILFIDACAECGGGGF